MSETPKPAEGRPEAGAGASGGSGLEGGGRSRGGGAGGGARSGGQGAKATKPSGSSGGGKSGGSSGGSGSGKSGGSGSGKSGGSGSGKSGGSGSGSGKAGGSGGSGGSAAASRRRSRGGRRRGSHGGSQPVASGSGSRPPAGTRAARPSPSPSPSSAAAPAGTASVVVATSPSSRVGARDPAKRARRRALTIAAVPAVVVLVVVGAIVALSVSVVVGLIGGAAAGLAWWVVTLVGGRRVLLHALRAQVSDDANVARAENLVDGLCATMGLVVPEILVVDDPSRNAVAFGWRPGDAALVVTAGLLADLGPVPLEGVLAHELAHIKRGDIAPATVAAAVLLPVAAFAPSAGSLVHRWAGIGREFRADTVAVGITRFPPGLREGLTTMVHGPVAAVPSPLADSAVARATRWLWAVALPVPGAPGAAAAGADPLTGQLDAPLVRIAALDER